ncbi:MAG: hypothetical protein JXR95_02580 [Deltaproteobacteria bacterium]|nr:hypothetical protein [Deltaproteobacteria bacterium]
MLIFKPVLAVMLAMAVNMCSPENNTNSGDNCSVNNSNNEPDGGLVCGEPYDVSDGQGGPGIFGAKVTQYVHVNAAGIVETDTISKLLMKVEYHVNEEPMFARVHLCKLEIPAVMIPGQPAPTQMSMSDTVFDTLEPVDVPLYKEGETTCTGLSFDPAVTLFGVRLNDDFNDDIPVTSTSVCPDGGAASHQNPCLWDMDNDGEIVITLQAENLPGIDVKEVYMAMRSWTSAEGIVATDDLILGEADWGLEQYAIGCRLIPIGATEERYCNDGEKDVVDNVNPVLGPIEGVPNAYMAVRIPDDMTCEELVMQADNLFGR